jgi:hypothetical protein
MSDNKLPFSEASGKKPLHGTYKVSFTINIDSEDRILASDFGLFITEGFGENLVEKVASLDVEKMYKTAKMELKPGDLVYKNRSVEVKATVVKDTNGIYCVGSIGQPVCEDYTLMLPRGIVAEVNKVFEGQAELLSFDHMVEASFINPDTDEPFWENVLVNKISIDLDAVEKIENAPKPLVDNGEVA